MDHNLFNEPVGLPEASAYVSELAGRDRALVVVLGDQLSVGGAALAATRPDEAVVLMAEVAEEATYVRHHKKKIAFVFTAMRHFAARLRAAGWVVDYRQLDHPDNGGSLTAEVESAVRRHRAARVLVMHPGEWRVLEAVRSWQAALGVPVEILPDNRFLCSQMEFAAWARGRRQLRMEYFYREMRRRTGLLMDGDQPAGGQWNFDAANRKGLPAGTPLPEVARFEPDATTREVLTLVADRFAGHFGDLEPFWFAADEEQAGTALEHFLRHALPHFGDFQDAMRHDARFVFHSVLSPYLNAGLLDPLAVCRAAEAEYRAGRAPLNAVEGFIRQIIGWREYVRGIYWLKMPQYAASNFFAAERPLPEFYWTAATRMACVAACVRQTREEAYAHHIQRLMVTGTFALLAGISPQALHEWYLAVYADAYEWVELPNTIGMSQFADGGLLASKPYAASGNYINKMSDYCRGCAYDVKVKTGERACPFNYLYWDFLARHRKKLAANMRMAPMYRVYDKMQDEAKDAMQRSAQAFLQQLDAESTH